VFEQRAITSFDPNEKRDVLIVFRSPNLRALACADFKVWWSCDQYTVGDFRRFSECVNKIVCISKFHQDFFRNTYGITDTVSIDLPVRVDDYRKQTEKIPNRIIFTSVPDRGLPNLRRMWKSILQYVPESTLGITADYRLWGSGAGNEHHRIKWIAMDNVTFYGAVNRAQLTEIQLSSDLTLYPSNYDELFCIAIAESLVAGSFPITSGTGALPTTNLGRVLDLDANNPNNDILFVDAVVELLRNRSLLEKERKRSQEEAIKRFHPDIILDSWNKLVFEKG
jgi:glycosyltransferase involved in cell wall biosynthesis